MNISEHFTLEEFVFSEAAARLGLQNIPNAEDTANLKLTAAFMESIRTLLGDKPIIVHSAYRSVELNTALGGVGTSAHLHGLACDFICPAFGTPAEVARKILNSGLIYDQLILEYGWVHVGLPQHGATARNEALTKASKTAPYEAGINS
jgi:hypothetical protein